MATALLLQFHGKANKTLKWRKILIQYEPSSKAKYWNTPSMLIASSVHACSLLYDERKCCWRRNKMRAFLFFLDSSSLWKSNEKGLHLSCSAATFMNARPLIPTVPTSPPPPFSASPSFWLRLSTIIHSFSFLIACTLAKRCCNHFDGRHFPL